MGVSDVMHIAPEDLRVGDVVIFRHGDIRIEAPEVEGHIWQMQDGTLRDFIGLPTVPVRRRDEDD